jgi:hypothetical protein
VQTIGLVEPFQDLESRTERSVLPIPYPDGLIIRAGYNPRKLMMEEHCSNIVQMASESKHAAFRVVIPYFDSVIISTRHKHGLRLMKINTSNWAIMFFISIYQCSHSIIPQLDGRGV